MLDKNARLNTRLAILLFSLGFCFLSSYALAPGQAAASDFSTLLIGAHNKSGTPAQLSESDLQLKIDGKPVAIQAIGPRQRPALRYCLIIDASASERPRFKQQQDGAIDILSKIVQPGLDYGLLVPFNDQPYLDGEGTDPRRLIKAVDHSRAFGATALYDTMITCSNQLVKDAPGSGLRVMFLLSDGGDNASQHNREMTLQALLKAGMKVYAIGHPASDSQRAVQTLNEFTARTGGRAYLNGRELENEKAVADISNELENSFVLTFAVPNHLSGGHPHKLEVKCSKKDINVTAPQYYYEPEQIDAASPH